jgi:hypothetical protein
LQGNRYSFKLVYILLPSILPFLFLSLSHGSTAWGTDTDLVLQEFQKWKPELSQKLITSTHLRIQFHLAYMRSTGMNNDAVCDACIAVMNKDGVTLDSIAYCAMLLHTNNERRIQYVLFVPSTHCPCAQSTRFTHINIGYLHKCNKTI